MPSGCWSIFPSSYWLLQETEVSIMDGFCDAVGIQEILGI